MKFHDKSEMNVKNEVHTEKFNKNSIKFDLQPIQRRPPKQKSPMSRALVPVEKDAQQMIAGRAQLALPPAESQSPIKEARGYNELMDEYSLHQLMFRKGKLID